MTRSHRKPLVRRSHLEVANAVVDRVTEDPEATDLSIAASLGLTEQRVQAVRQGMGIPAAYERRRFGFDAFLARCSMCHRWYSLGQARVGRCPACGGPIEASSFRIREVR